MQGYNASELYQDLRGDTPDPLHAEAIEPGVDPGTLGSDFDDLELAGLLEAIRSDELEALDAATGCADAGNPGSAVSAHAAFMPVHLGQPAAPPQAQQGSSAYSYDMPHLPAHYSPHPAQHLDHTAHPANNEQGTPMRPSLGAYPASAHFAPAGPAGSAWSMNGAVDGPAVAPPVLHVGLLGPSGYPSPPGHLYAGATTGLPGHGAAVPHAHGQVSSQSSPSYAAQRYDQQDLFQLPPVHQVFRRHHQHQHHQWRGEEQWPAHPGAQPGGQQRPQQHRLSTEQHQWHDQGQRLPPPEEQPGWPWQPQQQLVAPASELAQHPEQPVPPSARLATGPEAAAALLWALRPPATGSAPATGETLLSLLQLLTDWLGQGPGGSSGSGEARALQDCLPSADSWQELESLMPPRATSGPQACVNGGAGGQRAPLPVHTALPAETLRSVLAPGLQLAGGGRAAAAGASSGESPGDTPARRYEFLGPHELKSPHFLEQTGGYGKSSYHLICPATWSATAPDMAAAASQPSAHGSGAACPVGSAGAGARPGTAASAAPPPAGAAWCAVPVASAGVRKDAVPTPIVPNAWYLCDYLNSTHCLEHHGLRSNKCQSKGHPTHQVTRRALMFCLQASDAPTDPGAAAAAVGKGSGRGRGGKSAEAAAGGGAAGARRHGQRERQLVRDDGGGCKLYRVHLWLQATRQWVVMLFGTTWPAWYTALPPATVVTAAADVGGAAAGPHALPQDPSPLLSARKDPPARQRRVAPAAAAAGIAAAAGDAAGQEGIGVATTAAAGGGGVPAGAALTAGTQAQRDADLAQVAIRLCLRPDASLAHWTVFLEADLRGLDGKPADLCRLLALRDGNQQGFGLLNIILNQVAELLGLRDPPPDAPAAPAATAAAEAAEAAEAERRGQEWEARKEALEERAVAMLEALFDGCWCGAVQPARELLLQKDVSWQDTALHTCCRYNLLRVLAWLLPRCDAAVLTAATKSGWAPPATACRAGHEDAAVACLARLRELGVMGVAQYRKVLLADLGRFNDFYAQHQGRAIMERALERVWPDPSTRPRMHEEVGSREQLVDLQKQLERMQLQGL